MMNERRCQFVSKSIVEPPRNKMRAHMKLGSFVSLWFFTGGFLYADALSSPMASNSLRQRLLNGGKSYGPLILSDSPVIAELLGGIGYDHCLIDMEHGPSNLQSCQRLLQAMDASSSYSSKRTEALVRLDSPHNPVAMKKILDSMRLPGGILVPMVEDAKTAENVVRSARYPRQADTKDQIDGMRGCAVPFVRSSGWGSMSNDDYLRKCNEDLLLMVQVESPRAVEAIDDIARVGGIDLIFLGPFDLSCSAGKLGDFNDPDVMSLISRAEKAVIDSPCLLGGFRTPGVELSEMFKNGYSLVCGAVDLGLLRDSARRDAKAGHDAIKGA